MPQSTITPGRLVDGFRRSSTFDFVYGKCHCSTKDEGDESPTKNIFALTTTSFVAYRNNNGGPGSRCGRQGTEKGYNTVPLLWEVSEGLHQGEIVSLLALVGWS